MTEICEKPAISLENKLDANVRDFELYKVSAIGLATFCGSVLAGGILLSQNFERLGKRDEAVKALWYSTIALIALLIIGYNIPDEWNIPNIAWNIPQILAMIQIAKKFQENDINKHVENGGSLASNWKAFGISLLVILGIVLLVIGASILFA